MTVSPYLGINTALRGLQADQEALDTISHNIANANTPGYSRQTVDLTESHSLTIPAQSNVTGAGVQIGTGVDATTISRVRDQFLDIQYRAQNAAGNQASTQSQVLDQIQASLNEPSKSGLSGQLQAFWSSWSSLANDPTSLAARQQVIDAGSNVTSTLNTLAGQLQTIQSQSLQQYNALTSTSGTVMQYANTVSALNNAIAAAQAAGQNPNDLMDQRDKAIDNLSSLAKVSVSTQNNGMVNVTFGDAASPLVNGTTVNWPQTLTSAAGGQLGALLGLAGAGGQIAGYMTSLDSVANTLAGSVNALSSTPPFFSGTTAATLKVNATAATIQTTATGAAGGNELALAVSQLTGGAADQSYGALVAQIGSDDQAAASASTTQTALTKAINDQRQSTSGVSLDEEMTNLITFQRAYQASARVMTTIDQALDTLINHTGTVGL